MEDANPTPRMRREREEDHTPLWIKIFGGSILSISFLSVITLTGYIVSNINSIQSQVNSMNAEIVTKKEFVEGQKAMWESIKLDSDNIVIIKERMNVLEQFAKERQIWMDKFELKIAEQNKTIENISKEVAAYKEKTNGADTQLIQFREENRQFQKDIQLLRERVAGIEGKTAEKKKE